MSMHPLNRLYTLGNKKTRCFSAEKHLAYTYSYFSLVFALCGQAAANVPLLLVFFQYLLNLSVKLRVFIA